MKNCERVNPWKVGRAWYAEQIKYGRDIKHIADYLEANASEIKEILRMHKLLPEENPRDKKKKYRFEDLSVGDAVYKAGSKYIVDKINKKSIIVKNVFKNYVCSEKPQKLKVTKEEFGREWVCKQLEAPIKQYHISDLPKKEQERIRNL